MILRHKILILSAIIFLLAGLSLLNDHPVKTKETSLDKRIPFPVKQDSKAQWIRTNWFTKFHKTFSTAIVELSVIKINHLTKFATVVITTGFYYTTDLNSTLKDRSPPIISYSCNKYIS